ncbi:MAG: hypothetical protein RIB45_02985 [Marivibrio sp.]|uniref:hypothetical protein n=1 Tax=Marivibrio sp. TaxID=2039719 RepID=UPI0032EAEBA1
MKTPRILFTEQFDVPCTIEIQNTFESLHAHVVLDGDPPIHPGDKVEVHGEPIAVPYGESLTLERMATVRRAGPLGRWWTKVTGDLEVFEMFEVSFTSGRPV